MSCWGIDIGSTAVKAVEIRRGWQGTRVTRWELRLMEAEAEGNRRALIRAALSEIFPSPSKRQETIILSVPSHRTMIHRGILPFRDRKRNLQVLKFEAEPLIPLPIEEVLIDYLPIGEKGEGQEVLIFAYPKREMEVMLSILKETGIEAEAVIPEALAFYSLVNHAGIGKTSPVGALLDLGREKTTMVVWENGRLVMTRSIPILPSKRVGEGDPRRGEMLSSWRRLAEEVGRSLLAYEAPADHKRVEGIWITGGGTTWPGIAEFLAQETGRPVQPFYFGDRSPLMLREIPSEDAHPLAGAIGAALVGCFGESDRMNLRQEEFTSPRKVRKKRSRRNRLIAYGLILLMLGIGNLTTKFYLKEKRYQELKAEIRKEFTLANPGVKKIVNEVQQMRSRVQEEKAQVAALGGMAEGLAPLDFLRDLSALIEPSWKIRVTELLIDPGVIEVSGETDSFETVNRLKAKLEQSGSFRGVQLKTARAGSLENVVEFKFQMGWKGEG